MAHLDFEQPLVELETRLRELKALPDEGGRVDKELKKLEERSERLEGRSVAVIGQQKGRTTKQKLQRNFGMAHPEGYRKACRIMELAERYRRPVLTFIDTPGAYPGLGAEERGQSEAIGRALLT